MNSQPILTDALVEHMLAERAGDGAPIGLAQAISAAVATTPQVRRRWWAGIVAPTLPRVLQPAWTLMLLGLLAAGAVGAALIGEALLRQHDDLSVVVPVPTATPSIVTSSAFGPITWRLVDERDVPESGGVTGTPYGPVAMTDDGLRWLAADGTWPVVPFQGSDILTRVFVVGEDLIAGGFEPVWFHHSGSGWVLGERLELDGPMDVDGIAAGPQGLVITDGAWMQYSTDGVHFVRSEQPPDEERLEGRVGACRPSWKIWSAAWGWFGPVFATDEGFITLSTAARADANTWPFCEPVLWFSADGSSWDLVSPISPFGPGASVVEVATRGGRHVAIGFSPQEPSGNAVWVSDDGLGWERLPGFEPVGPCELPEGLPCDDPLSRVAAADPGWIILGREGSAWTSTDGRTWEGLSGWPAIRGVWLPQDLALSPGSLYVADSINGIAIGTFGP